MQDVYKNHKFGLQKVKVENIWGFSLFLQLSSALVEKLSRKNIEMGVGIISFNSSTQENHQRSFQAIDIPLSLPVKVRLNEILALISLH